jgi:hypothetical protein
MQRHRDQHVGAIEQLAPGARHPAAHCGRQIGARYFSACASVRATSS